MKSPLLICMFVFAATGSFSQAADSSTYYFEKGLAEKAEKRYKQAFHHFQKSLFFNKEHLGSLRESGLAAIEMKQYGLALAALKKADTLEPNNPIVTETLANLYFFTHRWDDAIRYALKMQQLNLTGRSDYIIGRSFYEKEDYSKSFRYLDAAYKAEPGNAEIPYLFARSFVDMSNYKMAAKYYQEAIKLDSSKIHWIYEMAMAYSAIPDDKTAIVYYEMAAAKGYKMDNDFIENLSTSYLLTGQPEKAIDMMKQLLEKKPADIELLYGLADTYYRSGKYKEAIEYWDKVLFYDKQHARSLYMIGMSYQKKGDNQKGKALCDKAIEMDPSLQYLRQKKMDIGL